MSVMGDLARQDDYLPDVGQPLIPSGGEFSKGTALGNAIADNLPQHVLRGIVETVRTPGELMKPNPYPEGSEAWHWYNDQRSNIENQWAPGMALNTIGTGGIAGAPVAANEVAFGAGAVRKKAPTRDAPGEILKPESGANIPETIPEQSTLARPSIIERYLKDPIRVANPGVYKRPDIIASEAAAQVLPEHPALKELFGVTRQDLYDISQQGRRQGNVEPKLWMPGKETKLNEATAAVMNPANEQRILDTLGEAYKHPELVKGMVPWYVMDPAYQRMVQLVGPERAAAEYTKFNMHMTPFSGGSDVLTEINRGTAARMMSERGLFPEFQRESGKPPAARSEDVRELLSDVKGHLMHKQHAAAIERYLKTGEHGFDKNTVKIPLYTLASGVPETGFQTRWAVPDTHFASAIGMPEVRSANDFRSFMGGPEYRPAGPWFREKIANPLGIEAVPTQALTWGTFAPQTGVRTGVGAGKLELLSQRIWERAKKLGVDPATLRDQVLRGEQHSSLEDDNAMGSLASMSRYG